MAKYEKVKCEMLPQLLLWKYPKPLFKKSIELTVDDGYAAVVNIDGKNSLVQPGKQILPMQDKKAGLSAEIYFVRTEGSNRFRWGAKPNVEMYDPIYNVPIRLMGYGTAAVIIQNPVTLVQSAKSGKFPAERDPLPDYFRVLCQRALKDSVYRFFSTNRVSLLYAPQYRQEIRSLMKDILNPQLNPLGLNVTGVIINSLEVVPDNNSIYVWNKICEEASRKQAEQSQWTAQAAANYYQPTQTYGAYSQDRQPAPAYNNAAQVTQTYSQTPAQQPAQAETRTAQPIQPDVQAPVQQPEPMNIAADPVVPQEAPLAAAVEEAITPEIVEEAPSPESAAADEISEARIIEAESAAVPEEPSPMEPAAQPETSMALVPVAVQAGPSEPAPVMKAEKFCPYCGQAVYVDDRFCPSCGKPVPVLNQ